MNNVASSPIFDVVIVFNFSHSGKCVLICHYGINLHFLMANGVKHHFILICHSFLFFRELSLQICGL